MSVPVRYSAASAVACSSSTSQYAADNSQYCSAAGNAMQPLQQAHATAETLWQRMSEGRFGTPDAAAAGCSTAVSISHNNYANNMDHYQQEHPPQQLLKMRRDVNENNMSVEMHLQQQQQLQQDKRNAVFADDTNPLEQQQLQQPLPEQPSPPTEVLFAQLHEALALESKYQPSLYLPKESQNGEVTIGTRDGAAHVLRCLKVWYELPSEVLFTAINLVDRFLTKMKVKPKHIACISVGSFHLAVNQLGLPKMDTEDLVAISQCRCTSGDLERMAGIIANKLGVQMNQAPVTALTCLRLFYYIFKNAAHEMGIGAFYDSTMSLHDLEMRLEILTCDANCASIRASELALVLVCAQIEVNVRQSSQGQRYECLISYAIEMQNLCRISEGALFESFTTVDAILSKYNGQHKMPYRQRLVWKLSSRTMRVLRPTDRLTSHLPTIDEVNIAQHQEEPNHRFRTGSVSSEEGEDWPTSPVVPVYEQVFPSL